MKFDANAFKKAAEETVRKALLERVRSARCPVHNEGPKNIKTSGHNFDLQFEACCDRLKEKVAAAFR